MLVRLRAQRHARAVRVGPPRAVLARQPSPGERAEGGEGDAARAAGGEELTLRRAIEQAEGVLHAAERRPAAGLAGAERERHLRGRDVARADLPHLPGAYAVVERAQRLLERRLRIPLVHQVEVEPIGLQAREARVD